MIELKNICKSYGGVKALDDVSLLIEEGEFAAVTGPSGSGKSTLMNMAGCLDRADSGSYLLDGIDTDNLTERELSEIRSRMIAFVFQGFNLIPGLTAEENAELPLIYRGLPKEKCRAAARAALRAVSMGERMTHRPSQLSGGQQQRVAIARALSADTPILLADEPTGSLDRKTGREIMELLRELNRRGRTVLLITHDMSAAEYAGRIISVCDGKITSDVKNILTD